ncbi:MAG: TRIC cation channel family protein, partial [Pseudomonadota bacterium]|nr:TRIC cation channel family protein [Pseudomonadota bacterium]
MPDISTWGHSLRTLVEVVGTVAFALSGILAGARKRMDIFGISVLGFLAAFGGGTLRDVLLDRRPFFWFFAEVRGLAKRKAVLTQ